MGAVLEVIGGRWNRLMSTVLLGSLLLSPGCHGGEASNPAPQGGAGQTRRYTVRGEVVRAAAPTSQGGEVFIRHEPIDDFTDSSGKVVGMASMTMPFPMGPEVLSDPLAAGDKVELRFLVDWSGPAFRVERIQKLPPATRLRFGPAALRSKPVQPSQ